MSTTNETRELSISRLINAPQELVWEAWTNPEHIRHWWGPVGFNSTISKMEVTEGGEWIFVMHGPDGTDYKNKHVYIKLEKPSLIIMRHESFPPFVMTARFEAKGTQTLVTLHSVFESASQLQEVIKVFKADEGMVQNITRMDEYITGKIYQVATPIVIERNFKASTAIIWNALTDLSQLKKWYFDLDGFQPVPGFRFRFAGKGSTGEEYMHDCRVLEVIPGKKIAYSWTYENREGYSVVSFELFPDGDQTRLVLTHTGVASFAANGSDFMNESFTQGWTEIIGNQLRLFLEAGTGND
ncbi:MAG: SRPBCC domain-containing protein [Chitinophagaceae bacterium]|nr:SRPBCC domain-containing protein [Chitinophagaceae bacterium]